MWAIRVCHKSGGLPISTMRFIHCSSATSSGQDWRRKQGQPSNANSSGPFADLPDYTFLDGRPTPPRAGQVKRAIEQQDITNRIMNLTREVEETVQFHSNAMKEEQERKDAYLKAKLKPKGQHFYPSQ